MSPLSIRSFTLFREEQPVRDALVLFTLTLLLHFFGAMLRLVQELSFFWPLNAVMAGIFARYIWLNRSYFYAICFAAMLVYDGLTSRWGMGLASFLINFSNIVFIVTLAQLILWDKRRADSMPGPINALSLFCYCLLAALLCAAVGALGSVDVERATFIPQLADWFSEQFSTAVLILPFILTLTLPSAFGRFRLRQLLPAIALVLSIVLGVAVGGAGSITFPLPALIWCAIRYPLPLTCLLTFITGISEILLVANSLIHLTPDTRMQPWQLFSTRLGIAAMLISPIIVASSVEAINNLVKQLALRADFDFQTRVYSRSGLSEALKRQPLSEDKRLTVMVLDIDGFKQVNDRWGHECGDCVLAQFAQQVRLLVGEEGMVARIGGEEFAVAALTSSERDGQVLAEKIRQGIESQIFTWGQYKIQLTVSMGLESQPLATARVTDLFNQLLMEADDSMIRAKRAGRNRIFTHEMA
ncbi:GGDEF domain-containing protein [Klebsiella grimontii]|uniref:GGDEF domain-containing protein n=1 Tax=Klebsiella grimontii TaxID=2058152 RepID=UPI0015E4C08D|nr:GGDEF domain-containing protein [Klebsiella grimontii]QLN79085.1 diguanylate cyclase [Klebsiella grimontii]